MFVSVSKSPLFCLTPSLNAEDYQFTSKDLRNALNYGTSEAPVTGAPQQNPTPRTLISREDAECNHRDSAVRELFNRENKQQRKGSFLHSADSLS